MPTAALAVGGRQWRDTLGRFGTCSWRNREEADFFLRFSEPPVIGNIRVKKIGPLEYEFEAVDAMFTNEDGWLVNRQWDFDYR